jgi:hypothetical protein
MKTSVLCNSSGVAYDADDVHNKDHSAGFLDVRFQLVAESRVTWQVDQADGLARGIGRVGREEGEGGIAWDCGGVCLDAGAVYKLRTFSRYLGQAWDKRTDLSEKGGLAPV